MTILIWNVRGLNRPSMQVELRHKLLSVKASLVALLETKIKPTSFHYVKTSILPNGWMEVSNVDICSSIQIWLLGTLELLLLKCLMWRLNSFIATLSLDMFNYIFLHAMVITVISTEEIYGNHLYLKLILLALG